MREEREGANDGLEGVDTNDGPQRTWSIPDPGIMSMLRLISADTYHARHGVRFQADKQKLSEYNHFSEQSNLMSGPYIKNTQWKNTNFKIYIQNNQPATGEEVVILNSIIITFYICTVWKLTFHLFIESIMSQRSTIRALSANEPRSQCDSSWCWQCYSFCAKCLNFQPLDCGSRDNVTVTGATLGSW